MTSETGIKRRIAPQNAQSSQPAQDSVQQRGMHEATPGKSRLVLEAKKSTLAKASSSSTKALAKPGPPAPGPSLGSLTSRVAQLICPSAPSSPPSLALMRQKVIYIARLVRQAPQLVHGQCTDLLRVCKHNGMSLHEIIDAHAPGESTLLQQLLEVKNFECVELLAKELPHGVYSDSTVRIKTSYIGSWFRKGWLTDEYAHGQGRAYYADGTPQYEGEWVEGKVQGQGKKYFEGGTLEYEGEWVDGKIQGQGKKYFEGGTLEYEGEYINGNPQGQGKMKWAASGAFYEGSWKNGNLHGMGQLVWEDGQVTIGRFEARDAAVSPCRAYKVTQVDGSVTTFQMVEPWCPDISTRVSK